METANATDAYETPTLPLDDAIGQCLMFGFDGYEPTAGIVELIEQRRVGGVILFARNCRDAAQTLALTTQLQAIARASGHPYPLLIGIDQENGLVHRLGPDATPFPGNMALGAVDSEELTEAVAGATASELHAVGINLNFAPVADVNNNPANPVIGVRSFGADPVLVERHVAAAVRGAHRSGVIATLKHFPGHGDTATDSHVALPLVPDDRARLDAVELPPFRTGIAAGSECIMVAHVALPRLTGGRAVPATLSPEIVNGLLRTELGYDGVVSTDCLEMAAVVKGVGVAAGALAALHAGNDIVLVSHRLERQCAAIDALRAASTTDETLCSAVLRSARRVLALKRRRLSWDTLPNPTGLAVVGSQSHRQLSDEAFARGVTILRNDAGLLPISPSPSDMLIVMSYERGPTHAATSTATRPGGFADELRHTHPGRVVERVITREMTPAQIALARPAASECSTVLLVTLNAHRDAAQRTALREALAGARRVIGLAVGEPNDASVLPEISTYVACYDYSPKALRAAFSVIMRDEVSR